MKKAVITLLLLFGLLLPSHVSADCDQVGLGACPASMTNRCAWPVDRCCSTPDECDTQLTTERLTEVCDSVPSDQYKDCYDCMGKEEGGGVWTALGCISTTLEATGEDALFPTLLRLGMGIGGGIAFLLILFGGLQILTSAGNPEQLNAGRELISSAIIGLLLIIFSIFLLRFIGFNIIGIPGFGG